MRFPLLPPSFDMWTEKANDGMRYKRVAAQENFDKF